MATAVVKDCELKCPICLEKFNTPKKLPCSHTFCEPCIQSYVQAETTEETKFFRCPLCRFKIEWSTLSASEWTQSKLQTDHMILALLERETNDSTPKQVYCEPCKIANEKNVAVHHCTDCKEFFCEQCFNYLHKRKIDNNLHTVTGITPDTDLKPLEMDEPCPLHSGKVLEVFCFDHKKLCCSICFATEHRKCDTVTSLDEIANEKKEHEEIFDIDDFLNKLSDVEQCTKSAVDKAKENLGRINGDKESMLQSIADIISSTKSHLDTLHEELKLSIEKTFSDTENCQQFDIECLVAFQKTLVHDKGIIEAIKEHGSRKQKFVTLEKTKDALEKHFKRLCLAYNFSDSKKYVLDIKDELKDVQTLSTLATLPLQQSGENIMTDIKNKLCPLGCIGDQVTFQGSFPVSDVSKLPQFSGPFFHAKTLSKWVLKLSKKDGMLSMFLRCLSADCTDSSYEISTEFRLVNEADREKDIIKKYFNERFLYDSPEKGCSSIINWRILENEYISNDMMKIQVKVW